MRDLILPPIKTDYGDFCGGPVIEVPGSLCRCWGGVPSLVGELRSHIPHSVAKKSNKQTNERTNNNKTDYEAMKTKTV